MTERMKFVLRLEDGERMTDLCREFGISRKTGYKMWNRYREHGPPGLFDEPRRPKRTPHKTPEEVVGLILTLKQQYPSWGAKKLQDKLRERHPGVRVPAPSTVHEIMRRHGLVQPSRRRKPSTVAYAAGLASSDAPNQVWSADYKGQFRLRTDQYCYPLTISDHFSRYFLACEGLESTRHAGARGVFDAAFRQYGLPRVIRTDNGAPFATRSLGGLSKLSVWWLKLGVLPERIEPGHPEQNGRHERLHLTLKRETTRPAAKNFLQQQERFDRFVHEYNVERPHESLDMRRPADLYTASDRAYDGRTPEPDYPMHDDVLRVTDHGHITIGRTHFHITRALADERVGVRELEPNRWLVTFAYVDLGHIDLNEKRFEPIQPLRLAAGHSSAEPEATAL